jgi:carbon monoxide dehydrogenase subunit G
MPANQKQLMILVLMKKMGQAFISNDYQQHNLEQTIKDFLLEIEQSHQALTGVSSTTTYSNDEYKIANRATLTELPKNMGSIKVLLFFLLKMLYDIIYS